MLVVAVVVAALLAPAVAVARPLHHPRLAQVRPRAFASCADLVGYAGRHFAVTHGIPARGVAPLVQPTPMPFPAEGAPQGSAPAAPVAAEPTAGTTFSTTNNQEEGVDEPDIVKTDGTTIFAVAQGKLFAVDAGGPEPRLVGSLDLGPTGWGAQLLLRGSRLIVISGGGPVPVAIGAPTGPGPQPAAAAAIAPYPIAAKTVVTEVDVHDPAAMKVARTMTIDGTYVDARQNGSTARVVISSTPRAVGEAATRGEPKGWVPARRFRSSITGRHYVRAVAACRTVRRPVHFSGLGMLTILTIDLDRGLWAADSDALMADAQVVYGSPAGLYVATQKWIDPATPADQVPSEPSTVIHRFDVSDPDRTTFASSGEVRGYLLNQFSLSEYRGHLRVATTSRPAWWPGAEPEPGESLVTVLDERGPLLVPVGQVAGLGKGQQIYSVRFLGDTGYVVTFRRIDPLYTIDLSTPTAPRVAGQLELEGYSAYLHPAGPGLLLGIGRNVSANEPSGVQVELFDVSDASAPKLLQRATLGAGSSSEVDYDHHAFLFWPRTRLAVLPVQVYDRDQPFAGAIGYRVDRSGIAEAGRLAHDAVDGYLQPIRRSIVIGDRLFTVSDAGAMASDLTTLARQAYVAFPRAG